MKNTELTDTIWAYKYVSQTFDDLILEKKNTILNYLKNPKSVPSFIFYSDSFGTGKTSCSKLIIDYLKCDSLQLNASSERGIDTIRDKVSRFAMSLSSNPESKRCVFLDESCRLTSDAQDCLKNLMDTYQENCFFIFSCNNYDKIKEGIKSRCACKINFGTPDEEGVYDKLEEICKNENFGKYTRSSLLDLVGYNYPDIRSMIHRIQECSIDDIDLAIDKTSFKKFLMLIKKKDVQGVYETVYSKGFDALMFNKWMFKVIFDESDKYNLDKFKEIIFCLADNEKSWLAGSDIQIVFLANIIKIMDII